MCTRRAWVAATCLALPLLAEVRNVGPSFIPDATVKAVNLNGWRTVGQANWKAENGELVGKAAEGSSGWLMLDHSYQDVAFYSLFRCADACDTGVLLRAQKTAAGTKGVYLSLKGDEVTAYNVTLDNEGKETGREKARLAGGQIRFAPPPKEGSSGGPSAAALAAFRASQVAPPGVTLPISRPPTGLRKGDWNEIEILLDADIIRAFGNDGGVQASAATEDMNGFGPVALYVGPGTEVRFKDIAYKDLATRTWPKEQLSSRFRMQQLSPFYYGWSAAAADFNHDGIMDLASGAYYYLVPTTTPRARSIRHKPTIPPPNTQTTTGSCTPTTSRATVGPTS